MQFLNDARYIPGDKKVIQVQPTLSKKSKVVFVRRPSPENENNLMDFEKVPAKAIPHFNKREEVILNYSDYYSCPALRLVVDNSKCK